MNDIETIAVTKQKQKQIHKSAIPESILLNEKLNASISALLPSNYNFEIHKAIHQIRQFGIKCVGLQLPEGLQIFAAPISFILEKFAYSDSAALDIVILADVTFGACCIDDYSARALGCDLLIHYGHSCLVPITTTGNIKVLYVFVDIQFEMQHLVDTVLLNFPSKATKIALLGTIQFASSLQLAESILRDEHGYIHFLVPQEKPLSPGEVLGCTSPKLSSNIDIVLYLGDGRFHLEAIMIANPHLSQKFYRYLYS